MNERKSSGSHRKPVARSGWGVVVVWCGWEPRDPLSRGHILRHCNYWYTHDFQMSKTTFHNFWMKICDLDPFFLTGQNLFWNGFLVSILWTFLTFWPQKAFKNREIERTRFPAVKNHFFSFWDETWWSEFDFFWLVKINNFKIFSLVSTFGPKRWHDYLSDLVTKPLNFRKIEHTRFPAVKHHLFQFFDEN